VLGNLRWRLLCLAALGFLGVLILMSAEFGLDGIVWPWAAPSYFERPAFPLYAIAASVVLASVAEFMFRSLAAEAMRLGALSAGLIRAGRLEALVLALCVSFTAATTLIASPPAT